MEAASFSRINSRWKKRSASSNSHRSLPFPVTLITLFVFSVILFLSYRRFISGSSFSISPDSGVVQFSPCSRLRDTGEKFLWYAPHSGFSNQLSELKNALLMAAILDRTLVVPPVLDHHAVVLGSCPKFRVLNPNELRFAVWNHIIELIRSRRYVSMADIIDISYIVPSVVRAIDFRVFASMWCGMNIDLACPKTSNMESSLQDNLRKCGSLLSGNVDVMENCLYAVGEDCRTTVWIYQKDGQDGVLDSFQPDEQLKKKKKISFVRKRRDVYKSLGPGSRADVAAVLAFGTLFTAPYKGSESYIAIHDAPTNQIVQSLIEKLEYIPFVPEILSAGKKFSLEAIKAPFLCAQLRLLDGQFKNHWKITFLGLKQKLESLRQSGPLPIHIFVMTDLPPGNWTGTYLGDISQDTNSFKLHFLNENESMVKYTAKRIMVSGRGLKLGSNHSNFDGIEDNCTPQLSPDMLLYLEESVCSCASLGFVGTAGSTIAESIELMRKHKVCLD